MNILMNTMCLNEAISIYKKHFYFIYLIDIVIESF
jgi:hypothetical protein